MTEKTPFDMNLVKSYPHAHHKLAVEVSQYRLSEANIPTSSQSQTTYISPHGLEFQSGQTYPEGALLKINVNLPDYWHLKQKYVDYRRIDAPQTFKILGKVVSSKDLGKRAKKKLICVQTVNIDQVDEQVLKTYLDGLK